MNDDTAVTPDGTATVAAPPAAAPAMPAAPPGGYRLAMRFTGSGSEYFRIWIVNLLLILVTIGLYYPFAKVRRLRYFYGNTQLGGEEFDFHGNPWRMLRGFLLMAAFAGAYALGSRASAWAALVALVAMAAIWPALFRASMQFRLANTSWRGLRFQFLGTTADAYRAMWPMLLALLMYLGAFAFIAPHEGDARGAAPNPLLGVIAGAGALLAMALTPWFSLKRYQHGHYALGPVRTELRVGARPFYGVFLKSAGLSLLFLVPVFVLGFMAAVAMAGAARAKTGVGMAVLALPIVALLSYLGMLIVAGSFVQSRPCRIWCGITRAVASCASRATSPRGRSSS
jgi:uncharacterized membrane protein YjgN (DUF898 family)